MIILIPKHEILEMVKGSQSILVVGCGGCPTVVQTGCEKRAESLALDLSSKVGGVDRKVRSVTTRRQCDRQIVATTLEPLMGEYETVMCMGCGAGTQVVADLFQEKVVLPGTETKLIGSHDGNAFSELCSACGECIIDETGGICPVTRCPKSILNGPCGGQVKGKCEVGGWVKDCAWVQIYNRLKAQNRLELYAKFRLPRDYRRELSPGPSESGGER